MNMARLIRFPFRRPNRRHYAGLALTVTISLALGGWWLAGNLSPPPKKPLAQSPVPVVLARVQKIDQEDYTVGIGTVQAAASVTVRARVDGQLQKVTFREGQDVREGDLLARIDPRALQAQLEQARAQQQKDEALLANAAIDLKRYEELVVLDSASRQTLDTQRALVSQLQAAVRADQSAVELARVQLGYTSITAPLSGRTGLRLVDEGNLVRATEATGIVVVNQIDLVNLLFTLPESQFSRVNTALRNSRQALRVIAYGRENGEVLGDGRLVVLNNQIDTASGTIQLKAVIPNPGLRLWPGQFVNARLVLGKIPDALVLPTSAIQRGPNGTFVYAVRADRTVEVRPVAVERMLDGKAIVSSGVAFQDEVVAEGQGKLRPGMAISEATKKGADSSPLGKPQGGSA